MPRGKQYNEELLVEYLKRYKSAEGKAGRGQVRRWFISMTGCSWSTADKVLIQLRRGDTIADVAEAKQIRKLRKHDLRLAQERRDALIVHGIKSRPGADHKWIPTDRALEMAEDMGLISRGKYTRATMDRILAREGLNYRSAGIERMAHRLTSPYAGYIYLVDATTMDQYFLRLDGTVHHYDTPRGDQHLEDYLHKHQLVKIWVYYFVDVHSKAFLTFPVIPLRKSSESRNGGENADDWMNALRFFFLPKRGLSSPLDGRPAPLADCPVEGIPTILFCDRGSGIGNSSRVNAMCLHLGIQVKTHKPKKPNAKGGVETRIGAFKRRVESQLDRTIIKDFDHLVYFYQKWTHYLNQTKGYYDKWMQSTASNPIIRVDTGNLQDAMVSHIVRTVNGFGCIEIDGEEWFVTHDGKYKGTKTIVYRPPARNNGEIRYIAELYDRTVLECSHGVPAHDYDDIKSHPKTEGERNREEGRLYAESISHMITFDDILPRQEETNVVRMPSPAKTIETHSPVAPESFDTIERAWRWILNQTGLFKEEIPSTTAEMIQAVLMAAVKSQNSIPADIVIMCANLINKNKKQEVNQL